MLKPICFCLLLFISLNNYCQNSTQIDRLINKCQTNNELDSLAKLTSEQAVSHYKKRDYKKAIYYSNIEINARKKLEDTNRYKKSLFYLGHFLHKNKQFYKSINVYKKVIDSFKIDKRTFLAHSELARIYRQIGNYYQAETFYKKGYSHPQLLNNKELYGSYLNSGINYDFIETKGSLKKELLLLNKADSVNKLLKYTDKRYYSLNLTFGNYYKNDLTFSFKDSKKYYLKVLKKSKSNKDIITQIKAYTGLGELYNKIKNDSADFFLNKGLELVRKDKLPYTKLQYQLSRFYFDNGLIKESLINVNKSLNLIIKNSTKETDSLSINEFMFSNQKSLLFLLIKHKAKIYLNLFDTSSNLNDLKSALKNTHLADKLLDAIKQESLETQSKLFWQKAASEVYIQGVKAAQLLNNPENAFYFMEKNKALLLLENISENQLRKQAQVPITFLEEELEIKQKINRLENELNHNPINKDSLENEYYSAKIEFDNFIQSLKKKYPTYYNYKKPIDIVKLQDIQTSLDNNTMALEYIIDDTEGFVLAITKDKTSLHKLDSIKNINNKIESYLSLISKPITTKKEQNKYNIITQELYNSLFPFSEKELTQNITKLIVIPDYTLQNIPFESLQKANNNYLINDYEISYAYSLSFLEKNKTSTKTDVEDFIGFAPYSFNYDNLSTLRNSKKEIQNTTNHFSGVSLTDSLATKQRFLDNIKNYNIIHLATHAAANDSISSPWIAFRNKKLHLNELYTLKTSADLVVLSACKTSLGKINKGEGVFSLARGFFYSGSKSVISSLWNVNDKSSQEILSDFYANLKDGKTKSEALRQAKLNYINTHQLSEQSPYYWSSFVLIGDTTTIPVDSFSEYYPYLFVLFLIILGSFLYKKRTK